MSVNPAALTFRGHPAGVAISWASSSPCKEDSWVCPELQPTEKVQEVPVMPKAPRPFCSRRRSRCLCTGPGLPSAHGTSTRAVHTYTVETLGEHFQTMLLIKRSSFLRQVFPPSYLNRKYFFILDLPKSPTKYNPSPSRWVRAAPARGRHGAGWAASVGRPVCGLGAFPLPFLAHTAKSASVMCQMACCWKAGWFQRPLSSPLLTLPPGKHPVTSLGLPSWEYSTAGAGEWPAPALSAL